MSALPTQELSGLDPADEALMRYRSARRAAADARPARKPARRMDFHIVRERFHWQIQSAQGARLAVFDDAEKALAAARAYAFQLEGKGVSARVLMHWPGKEPEVFDYPGQTL